MLNSTLLGGYEARGALASAYLKGEVDSDWCIGSCQNWKETEEGRGRYIRLKKRWAAQKTEGKDTGKDHEQVQRT